jgi:DNA-binding transcriptional ArsR family regulator
VNAKAHEPRLARVAAMIADPARSRMLAYLLDGQYASAGELATAAGVQPSTASSHLHKLTRADLVVCEPRGRHRYFKLADGEVAQALQALALVAERGSHDRAWAHPERQRLREARCCYGHVAGRLGVALWEQLQRDGRLRETDSGHELTDTGRAWLATMSFEAPPARSAQRLAYGCLDWSERRDHMAGSLARQLLAHFVARGWLRQRRGGATQGGHRVLEITPSGRQQLLPQLGLEGPVSRTSVAAGTG